MLVYFLAINCLKQLSTRKKFINWQKYQSSICLKDIAIEKNSHNITKTCTNALSSQSLHIGLQIGSNYW
jgi:hypothetical protein